MQRSQFTGIVNNPDVPHYQFQPWPVFVDSACINRFKEAAVGVCDLILSIPGRLFQYDYDAISRYYELPRQMVEMLLHGWNDRRLKQLLGRGDYVLNKDNQLKCLEVNLQANLGGWELDLLQPLYVQNPCLGKFLRENHLRPKESRFFATLFHHLVSGGMELLNHPEASINGKRELNTVIAFAHEETDTAIQKMLQFLYTNVLEQLDCGLTGTLSICDVERLERDGSGLRFENRPVHLLVEMVNGLIPMPLMELVRQGKLLIYNGPITRLMSNKLNMALLSEHEDSPLFTAAEQEVIKRFIPWTRKVLPGRTTYKNDPFQMEHFLINYREQLVLKPGEGISGKGVSIGKNIAEEQWRHLTQQALQQRNWVVQEYVESQSMLFQRGAQGAAAHQAVWGFFTFGSQYAGGWLRIMPDNGKGVINSSQGAEETILIEVG